MPLLGEAAELMEPTSAVVTTLKVPANARGVAVVDSWVQWHLGIGFTHLFLFFDELPEEAGAKAAVGPASSSTAADATAAAALPPPLGTVGHPAAKALLAEPAFAGRVTVLAARAPQLAAWQAAKCPGWSPATERFLGEVPTRQCLNAETALAFAAAHGLDWLLHLDIDELFYPGPAQPLPTAGQGDGGCGAGAAGGGGGGGISDDGEDGGGGGGSGALGPFSHVARVGAHFAALDAEGVGCMTYMNHEGVPETEDSPAEAGDGDYFRSVTLFRRHHFAVPLTPQARAAMAFWEGRTRHGQYLLVYDCGKSACRVDGGRKDGGRGVDGVGRDNGGGGGGGDGDGGGGDASLSAPLAWRASSVHAWAPCGGVGLPVLASRTALADPRRLDMGALRRSANPCVLHYVTCGLAWLVDKYACLGRFEPTWAGLPIAPSFHLDARDAVLGTAPQTLAAVAADDDDTAKSPPADESEPACGTTVSTDATAAAAISAVADATAAASGAAATTAATTAAAVALEGAREFYRREVLFDTGGRDAGELPRQLAAGVCWRLGGVADALEAARLHRGSPPPQGPQQHESLESREQQQQQQQQQQVKEVKPEGSAAVSPDGASVEVSGSGASGGSKAGGKGAPGTRGAARGTAAGSGSIAGSESFQRAWILSSVAQNYL